MRQATLEDLKLEKWFRERWNGNICWKTKNGDEISINKMTDSHLENAINYLINKKEYDDIAAEYAAEVECNFG